MAEGEVAGGQGSSTMELLDKLDGFKRFMLVIPIEIAFILVVAIMAWQGQVEAALAAVTGVFGGMIGYYFGTHQTGTV